MKSRLLLFFIVFIFFDGFGQIGFEEHVVIDNTLSTNGANAVYTSDIDNDGFVDILSGSGEGKIAWYKNINGQGLFGDQQVIGIGESGGAETVYTSDLDGDGDLDVFSIVRNFNLNTISWYENLDSEGLFGEEQIIMSSSFYSSASVFTSDLDGDSDLDVLCATGNAIMWFENTDGQGTLSTQQLIEYSINGATGFSVTSFDIDNDGDMDVISNYEYNIVWYENLNGQGNFSASHALINVVGGGLYNLHFSDIDGDNDIDMFLAYFDDDKITWYENLDGQFDFGSEQIIVTEIDGVSSINSFDLDQDGDLDLVSSSRFEDKIVWYENLDGQGSFGSEKIISLETDEATSIYAGDIDNDGDLDVLSASYGDDKIAWYENLDGLGDFGSQNVLNKNTADGAYRVYSADIDGDGDKDILSSSLGDEKIAWYENLDGQGGIDTQHVVTIDAHWTEDILTSDIDGDGDEDIVAALIVIGGEDKIVWYENLDGLGNFSEEHIIANEATGVYSISSRDIDGDGDLDIISGGYYGNKVMWYKNLDGLGNFETQPLVADAEGVGSIDVNDMDGDGDLDIVAVSFYEDKIFWNENTNGQGEFGDQQIISTNLEGPIKVFMYDVDSDGDMDVISASRIGGKIAWYENEDGQGTFGAQIVISAFGVSSIYPIDLDGDGDVDLISAHRFQNKVAWFENLDGQGLFGTEQIISIDVENVEGIYADDMDGDGDMDVLAASLVQDKIVWFGNTGIVSIKENHQLQFSIFPIPTSGKLMIQSKSPIAQIETYDQLGQLVLTKMNANEIDLSNMSRGFYYCKVSDENGETGIKKVVKE